MNNFGTGFLAGSLITFIMIWGLYLIDRHYTRRAITRARMRPPAADDFMDGLARDIAETGTVTAEHMERYRAHQATAQGVALDPVMDRAAARVAARISARWQRSAEDAVRDDAVTCLWRATLGKGPRR